MTDDDYNSGRSAGIIVLAAAITVFAIAVWLLFRTPARADHKFELTREGPTPTTQPTERPSRVYEERLSEEPIGSFVVTPTFFNTRESKTCLKAEEKLHLLILIDDEVGPLSHIEAVYQFRPVFESEIEVLIPDQRHWLRIRSFTDSYTADIRLYTTTEPSRTFLLGEIDLFYYVGIEGGYHCFKILEPVTVTPVIES